MKTLAVAVAALALAATASGARTSVSLVPVPANPTEGQTVTFDVSGDDGGAWISTVCEQSGNVWPWGHSWFMPYYGYNGATTLDLPESVDTGEPMVCRSSYDEVTRIISGCWYPGTYPPPYRCTRTHRRATVEYVVAP